MALIFSPMSYRFISGQGGQQEVNTASSLLTEHIIALWGLRSEMGRAGLHGPWHPSPLVCTQNSPALFLDALGALVFFHLISGTHTSLEPLGGTVSLCWYMAWVLVLVSDHLVRLTRFRDALFTEVQGSGAGSLPSLSWELTLS